MYKILEFLKTYSTIFKISTAIFICSICSYSAYADIIHLKNGNDIEGIVIDTQEDKVTIKLNIGTMIFSTEDIESIEKSNAEERKTLEESWEEQKKRRQIEDKQKLRELVIEKISELKKKFTDKEEQKKEKPKQKVAKPKKKTLAVPLRINWVSNYKRGVQMAKNTGKPVMIDFYTDWCGWCKKLDKETYRDTKVRALSTQFVCIKIDAGSNKSLAKKYGITGYPTIIFLSPSGKQIGKIGGYLPAEPFAARMRKFIE